MHIGNPTAGLRAFVLIAAIALGGTAFAGDLQISVTNNQPAGGFAFSPVWIGLHDGTFDTFDPGGKASSALQAVAELADTSVIAASFAGHGDQTRVGSAPFGPGQSSSSLLNVADPTTNRFLSFAAMVVPSNDFFIANPNPKAFEIFDSLGKFLGPVTIQIFGRQVWDAGTEVNDINFGAAFIVGDNIRDRRDEGSTIALVFGGGTDNSAYLNSINGKATPYGYDISHLISPDDLIATIRINSVPEPSSVIGLAAGIGGIATAIRRNRRK